MLCQEATNTVTEQVKCRDRNGYLDMVSFRLSTCATCYGYLFPMGKELKTYQHWLVSVNGSIHPHLTMLIPDIHNASLKYEVCRTLNKDECIRWTECCEEAEVCCQRQQDETSRTSLAAGVTADDPPGLCPATWDGYGCWGNTEAGSSVSIACPGFIQHALPKGKHRLSLLGYNSYFTDKLKHPVYLCRYMTNVISTLDKRWHSNEIYESTNTLIYSHFKSPQLIIYT